MSSASMLGYYLNLALRSFRRNPVLTALMIAAIGAGIGTSMTTFTVFRAMSGDPIPDKSSQLYLVQLDSWGPDKPDEQSEDGLRENLSYTDAAGLMRIQAAKRQTPIYSTLLKTRPTNPKLKPAEVVVPAVGSDFFAMFEAPFRFGGPWTLSDDEDGNPVVVISRKLNNELFGGTDSVGKALTLENESYRVVGVLDNWPVVPRFYNLRVQPYGEIDEIFIPFNRAINMQAQTISGTSCKDKMEGGFRTLLRSECLWIQLWVELPAANDVSTYRRALNNYAAEQRRLGRFQWPPHTQLRDVMQWLQYRHVVPNELGLLVLASFGFLFVCLMNAMGLMLARIIGRSSDISVRRALGASRKAIIAQCLVECGLISLFGALVGLLFAILGVLIVHNALADDYAALTYLNAKAIAIEMILAVLATVGAGLYPTWRAAHVEPALQLKAE